MIKATIPKDSTLFFILYLRNFWNGVCFVSRENRQLSFQFRQVFRFHSTSRNLTSIAPRSSADFERMRIVISSRWEEKGLNIENLARSKIFLIGKKRHSLMNSRCITLRRIFTKPFSSFELNACQSVPCNSHINLTVSFSRRNEPCQPRIPINFANAPSRRAAISISVFRLREEATGKWNFERFSFFFLFLGGGEGRGGGHTSTFIM